MALSPICYLKCACPALGIHSHDAQGKTGRSQPETHMSRATGLGKNLGTRFWYSLRGGRATGHLR